MTYPEAVAEQASRRGFLADLLRSAVEIIDDARETMTAAAADLEPLEGGETRFTPGPPTTSLAQRADLAAIAADIGLGRRLKDVGRLARTSVRLTRVSEPADSSQPSDALVEIPLAEIAAAVGPTPLPDRGSLRLFCNYTLPWADCRTEVVGVEVPARVARHRVELSGELVLPGAWSPYARPLDLTPKEQVDWEEMRKRLAAVQGVELDDYSERPQSIHRMFGYADETLGDMEASCELAFTGRDRLEQGPRGTPWRLLLQLTTDKSLGLAFGEDVDRLYFWIRGRDLASVRVIRR